jgi:WD40 repeat protein
MNMAYDIYQGITDSNTSVIKLWNANTGRLLLSKELVGGICQLGFSPAANKVFYVAWVNGSHLVGIYDVGSKSCVELEATESFYDDKLDGIFDGLASFNYYNVSQIFFSPDESLIVAVSENGAIRVWEQNNGSKFSKVRIGSDNNTEGISAIAFMSLQKSFAYAMKSPSENGKATGYEVGICRLVPPISHKQIGLLEEPVEQIQWNDAGNSLFCESRTGISVWDVRTEKWKKISANHISTSSNMDEVTPFPKKYMTQVTHELVFESVEIGQPVAWYPVAMDIIKSDDSGRTWIGAKQSALFILKIEE